MNSHCPCNELPRWQQSAAWRALLERAILAAELPTSLPELLARLAAAAVRLHGYRNLRARLTHNLLQQRDGRGRPAAAEPERTQHE